MSNNENLSSDSSDEEYIPGGEESDVSCDASDDEIPKPIKKSTLPLKRKRKGGIRLDDEDTGVQYVSDDEQTENVHEQNDNVIQAAADNEKKKSDSLWADFMKDVGGTPKRVSVANNNASSTVIPDDVTSSLKSSNKEEEKKVSVTKIFDFAGEEIRVTKEVASGSKEAKQTEETNQKPVKRSGISGLLEKMNKKPKMSVLDKSKLDWSSFKDDEGISEELTQYKKSKSGYLDKQDFLQRADLRQFEIEKQIRLSRQKK